MMSDAYAARESAPMLKIWGPLSGRILQLVHAQPDLLMRLVVAPPRAIHSTAAYLHLRAMEVPDADAASEILNSHPRDLLRSAMPDAPPTTYRALERAGPTAREASYYKRLHGALAGPFSKLLLAEKSLDPLMLRFVERIPSMDILVQQGAKAIRRDLCAANGLDTMAKILRSLDVYDGEAPPRDAGPRGILRHVIARLHRAEAPAFSFPLPQRFRRLSSVAQLTAAGKRFANCLDLKSDYAIGAWVDLVSGVRVFLIDDAAGLCIALRHHGRLGYVLDECLLKGNETPSRIVMDGVIGDLAAVGIPMLKINPATAFRRLKDAAERPWSHGPAQALGAAFENEDAIQ